MGAHVPTSDTDLEAPRPEGPAPTARPSSRRQQVLRHSKQQSIDVAREDRVCSTLGKPLRFDSCGQTPSDLWLHPDRSKQAGLDGAAAVDFAAAQQAPSREVDARGEGEVGSKGQARVAAGRTRNQSTGFLELGVGRRQTRLHPNPAAERGDQIEARLDRATAWQFPAIDLVGLARSSRLLSHYAALDA